MSAAGGTCRTSLLVEAFHLDKPGLLSLRALYLEGNSTLARPQPFGSRRMEPPPSFQGHLSKVGTIVKFTCFCFQTLGSLIWCICMELECQELSYCFLKNCWKKSGRTRQLWFLATLWHPRFLVLMSLGWSFQPGASSGTSLSCFGCFKTCFGFSQERSWSQCFYMCIPQPSTVCPRFVCHKRRKRVRGTMRENYQLLGHGHLLS